MLRKRLAAGLVGLFLISSTATSWAWDGRTTNPSSGFKAFGVITYYRSFDNAPTETPPTNGDMLAIACESGKLTIGVANIALGQFTRASFYPKPTQKIQFDSNKYVNVPVSYDNGPNALSAHIQFRTSILKSMLKSKTFSIDFLGSHSPPFLGSQSPNPSTFNVQGLSKFRAAFKTYGCSI